METIFLNYNNNSDSIKHATSILKKGGIGIFPTDTVYGIGCDCLNTKALQSLYEVKGRDFSKPICILISSLDMLKDFAQDINPIEKKLIEHFWPGDLTIIFNKSKMVPDILNSGLKTIGVRMPNNTICLDLISSLGIPIATSSANISSEEPAKCINNKLKQDFVDKVDFIIDNGELNTGIPSTIVKVENNEIKILREGSIPSNKIMEVIKC